jgi:hypothetical protein
MSTVSSKMHNQNLVELAKRNYEKQQRTSRTPSIVVPLPSKGLIYPESSPLRVGAIEMRHMTAFDEDILTNNTYIKTGIVFDKLLEELTVSPVNINDISFPDREAMLISARIHAYGQQYPVSVTNPADGKSYEREVDLSKIKFKPFDLQSDENGEFSFEFRPGHTLKFRFLTATLAKKIDADKAVSSIMTTCIQEIDGNREANYILDFLKYEMTPTEGRAFRTYMNDNTPGLDFETTFQGEDGGTFTAMFQYGPDLFWF